MRIEQVHDPLLTGLSLPTVIEGTEYSTRVPGSDLLTTVAFKCQGSPVVVRLLKKSENGKH